MMSEPPACWAMLSKGVYHFCRDPYDVFYQAGLSVPMFAYSICMSIDPVAGLHQRLLLVQVCHKGCLRNILHAVSAYQTQGYGVGLLLEMLGMGSKVK